MKYRVYIKSGISIIEMSFLHLKRLVSIVLSNFQESIRLFVRDRKAFKGKVCLHNFMAYRLRHRPAIVFIARTSFI